MYNVRVPSSFLWSIDESFERRRWPPRAQTATVVDQDSYPFELTRLYGERCPVKMHWAVVINANEGLTLRAEWSPLRQGQFDS
jgi:hypothetical protein